jgi:hypothetical protein
MHEVKGETVADADSRSGRAEVPGTPVACLAPPSRSTGPRAGRVSALDAITHLFIY